MRPPARLLALSGMVASLSVVFGCEPSLEEVAERCTGGDANACRRACLGGVFDAGGCLGAGHRASLPKRGKFFDEACRAKLLEGCLEGAKVHLKMRARENYGVSLERACALGHAGSCERLGDLHLGTSEKKALDAYRRGCRLRREGGASCERESARLTKDAERLLAECQKDDLDACDAAVSLLAPKNHDAAYVAAERICQRRGLEGHYERRSVKAPLELTRPEREYDGCGLFLVARASAKGTNAPGMERHAPRANTKTPARIQLKLETLELHFKRSSQDSPEQLVEVKGELRQALEAQLPRALPCFTEHLAAEESTATGKAIRGNFIVDRLGEPLDVRATSDFTQPPLTQCVIHSVLPERFEGKVRSLERIPIVSVMLRVTER